MAKRRFRFKRLSRERVILSGIDATFTADLADVSNVSHAYAGTHFLLVVVDEFYKFIWVRPLK